MCWEAEWKRVADHLEPKGFTVRPCAVGHVQVRGTEYVVNAHKKDDGSWTLFVNGMHKGRSIDASRLLAVLEDAARGGIAAAPLRKTGRAIRGGRRTRLRMWRKDRRCYYCKRELALAETTLDHRIPLAKGGADRPDNFVLSCRECNANKADAMPHTVASRG